MPTEPADIRLLVDWNNDGDYDDTYDEITDDVLDITWQRGRDYASQLSGNSIVGKLTARLKNNDGKYSPSNASSPLAGSMLPARSVRLNAGSGTFPYAFPMIPICCSYTFLMLSLHFLYAFLCFSYAFPMLFL